jgi:hypothetical protein
MSSPLADYAVNVTVVGIVTTQVVGFATIPAQDFSIQIVPGIVDVPFK